MSAVYINDQVNFRKEVLESEKPVLLDFFASWCGPCKMVSPVLDAIAGERPDIKVVKVDIDKIFGTHAFFNHSIFEKSR